MTHTIGDTVAFLGPARESVVEDEYLIVAETERYLWGVGAIDRSFDTLTVLHRSECGSRVSWRG